MTTPNFASIDFDLELPAALIVIDLQPCGVDPDFGLAKALETGSPGFTRYLADRIRSTVAPAVNALLAAFHAANQPVFFTAFASAAGDGSDVITASIRKRNAERLARTGSPVVLPYSDPCTHIMPGLDRSPQDGILVKQSMDAFPTTNLAEELSSRGVRTVVVCGVYTDACVESTGRSAAERGYPVFVVEDACAAWTEQFHSKSLENLGRYFARVCSSRELVNLLRTARQA